MTRSLLEESMERRSFLSASSEALLSVWIVAASELRTAQMPVSDGQETNDSDLEFLSAKDAADLDAISAQIMPSDGTPGAREAGVVRFIDHGLATWAAAQRDVIIGGLDDLSRRVAERWSGITRFAALSDSEQLELLRGIEMTPFFQAVRFATLAGMFARPSYHGNAGGVGWRLIGFEERHMWQPPFGYYDTAAVEEGLT